MTSRRDFLRLWLAALCPDPFPAGQYLGTVPFEGADRNPPFHTLLDAGLDARLYTDLSALTPDTLITPNDRFFVRTSFPDRLDPTRPWTLGVTGLVRTTRTLSFADLEPLVRPAGPFVMECAGNNDPRNYGLMSAASWHGAPMAAVLDRLEVLPSATRVRISGFDLHSGRAESSLPGASWIFTLDELRSSGALLATCMNGEPLPRDHGWPVRLVVPGWYGCACIKWVNAIAFVDDSEPSTEQMREYAARTHQGGVPTLARDFKPASIDLAAMPIRIEKWRVGGRLTYRVAGIVWGGTRVPARLRIRFHDSEPYRSIDICAPPSSPLMWGLWTYDWRPPSAGRYQIVLKPEEGTPSRRLDMYFYVRHVWIDEV